MNIKPVVLSLCVILAACNGGGGGHTGAPGPQGAPGKSAYEIWLEQGNVGTEQDFLDSLVSGDTKPNPGTSSGENDEHPDNDYPKNMRDRIMNNMKNFDGYYDFSEQQMPWSSHGDYMQYNVSQKTVDGGNNKDVVRHYVYKEKELTLGNYWIMNSVSVYKDGSVQYGRTVGIDSREGDKANAVYDIQTGAIYSGGTFATALAAGKNTFLTGDATLKYDPTKPEITLNFDDYYDFKFTSTGQKGVYNVIITGNNLTGVTELDMPTGDFENMRVANSYLTDGFLDKQMFLRKDGVEEAFGEYNLHIPVKDWQERNEVKLWGVYGTTKQ